MIRPTVRNSVLPPELASHWGPRSRGALMSAAQPRGPCSQSSVRCYCFWSGHGRMAPPTSGPGRGLGMQAQSHPPEACSGSHMTAIQYLSVYVDNQRINDSCFFYSVVCSENRNMPTCPRGLILYKLLRAGYSGRCERRPGSEAWPLPVQPQARYLTSGTLGLSSV